MEKEIILTKEGLANLEEELETLKTVKRKEVSDRLKTAIDFGDISENSEYDDAKNEQAFIEGRIKTIENMLRNATVIEDDKIEKDKISIGSTVRVLDVELNEEEVYRIVGTVEADPMQNKISNESPLGNKLLGSFIGEEITVDAPVGSIIYKILAVENE